MSKKRSNSDGARRRFLADVLGLAGGSSLFGLGAVLYTRQVASMPADALRPPGALAEDDFQGACIRCGLCVRDCPFDTLRLASPWQEVPNGTPFFVARETPCEMCDDIPCVAACPTGALDPALTSIDEARMGVAVLIDRDNCLNLKGLRCDVCFRVCPLINEAITLETLHNTRSGKHAMFIPTVQADACTGCGKCEKACVLEEAAIKVLPRSLARGELGGHYRWGWEEKNRAGGSLVPADPEHRYNLPEGQSYEHGGRGLIDDRAVQPVPFPSDPLETLNRGPQP